MTGGELFNDPAKFEDKLNLNDGSKFFLSDPAERFGFLHKVDWTEALCGSKHRELHSMWVSLRQHTSFGSSTSSCSIVMFCQSPQFVLFQGCASLLPSVGSSLAIVTAAASS